MKQKLPFVYKYVPFDKIIKTYYKLLMHNIFNIVTGKMFYKKLSTTYWHSMQCLIKKLISRFLFDNKICGCRFSTKIKINKTSIDCTPCIYSQIL